MIWIVFRQRESGGSYITASSKNNFTWVRISYHLVLYYLFFFFSHDTIPRTPLSPLNYLFWSQTERLSPFGSTWDRLQPSSDHLPQCCFLREMFYRLCHREPNTNHKAYSVFATWRRLLTVYWAASLTSPTDIRHTYCNTKPYNSSFGYGSNNTGWLWLTCTAMQNKKKNITKLWENDSQSVDGHPDRRYNIISQQNTFCMEKALRMNWKEFPKAFPVKSKVGTAL